MGDDPTPNPDPSPARRRAPKAGAVVLGLVLSLGACDNTGAFECQSDAQCNLHADGQCQPSGYCSFADPNCTSGHRYGLHSGPWAGTCVDPTLGTTTHHDLPHDQPSEGSTHEAMSSTDDAIFDGSSTAHRGSTGNDPPEDQDDETSTGVAETGEPPLDPDLVLWLQLEPGFPGVARDSSLEGQDGSCEPPGCPASAPGLLGQGVDFDGIDDAIVVPHGPRLETYEGLTVATWLWLDAQPTTHDALLTKPLGAGIYNSWELYFFPDGNHSNLQFKMLIGGIEHYVLLPGPFTTGHWMHLAATWDTEHLKLWIDGVEIGSASAPGIELDDHPVYVGADDDHGPSLIGHFDGRMDDVRIYRRALEAVEIEALALPIF
ncbi:MAG: LamG domain-containing protein [Myxococcota bacterium]